MRLKWILLVLVLAACSLNEDAAPPAPNAVITPPAATLESGASGVCTIINNSSLDLEINSPDDIGTIIGLVAPGERLPVDGLVPADDSDEVAWIIVTTADAGEGFIDPAGATLEGDCDALIQTAG